MNVYCFGERQEARKVFFKSENESCGREVKKKRDESFAVPWSRKVYLINIQYSSYQQNSGDINTYTFEHKKRAQKFMRSEAKKLYYKVADSWIEDDSSNNDRNYSLRENTPPTLLGHRGPYWYECKNCIFFGEDYTKGECFERTWGKARLYETIVDRQEE